jgi:hypothetical protein
MYHSTAGHRTFVMQAAACDRRDTNVGVVAYHSLKSCSDKVIGIAVAIALVHLAAGAAPLAAQAQAHVHRPTPMQTQAPTQQQAQAPTQQQAQAQAQDSVQTVHAARRDLARYERELMVVPATLATQPRQPSERERAHRALRLRQELLARLDSAAALVPGDDWIIGQRVGLRIQQADHAAATRTAAACRATPWWCSALLGFALHLDDRIVEAEAAFDAALDGMPMNTRCGWAGELAALLEEPVRSRYVNATCSARDSLQAHIWWLADPFLLRPGNERKTEHYARLVAMQLHHMRLQQPGDYAPYDFSMAPCHDHHKPLIRGGWPETWWERGSFRPPSHGYGFVPRASALLDPFAADEAAFDARAGTDRERYAPSYASVSTLPQQTAFFLRDDSLLVATAMPAAGVLSAGVALTSSGREAAELLTPYAATADAAAVAAVAEAAVSSADVLRFTGTVAAGAWVVSVESFGTDGSAARSRFGRPAVEPTHAGVALSDLLLIVWPDAPQSVGEDLADVLPRMLATTELERDRPVGVFWEVYGAARAREQQLLLSVTPLRPGLLRRAAELLRLRSADRPITMQWDESDDAAYHPSTVSRRARAIRLDISQLPTGSYLLRIEVREAGGSGATAQRVIMIR